jgi:hypothetical protein
MIVGRATRSRDHASGELPCFPEGGLTVEPSFHFLSEPHRIIVAQTTFLGVLVSVETSDLEWAAGSQSHPKREEFGYCLAVVPLKKDLVDQGVPVQLKGPHVGSNPLWERDEVHELLDILDYNFIPTFSVIEN